MAVDGNVVAGLLQVALLTGVDAAPDAVLLVEVPLQVVVLVVCGRLHHGVIHLGAFDLDPARKIRVHVVQLSIIQKDAALHGGVADDLKSGLRGFCRGRGLRCLCGGAGLRLIFDVRKVFVTICLLLAFQYVSGNQKRADAESDDQNHDHNNIKRFFHAQYLLLPL